MSRSSLGYFSAVALQWDELRKGFFSESVREAALDALSVKRGRVAADLGAGAGFVTEGLLARGLKVIAVDQSKEMLAIVKNEFRRRAVECRLGEADALPLADASVD